jgi:hypothetical protein
MRNYKEIITATEPEPLAEQLMEAFNEVQADPFTRLEKYKQFSKRDYGQFEPHVNLERMDDFHRCYGLMVSVRQSGVSTIGTLGNELLAHTYEQLGFKVIREHKLVDNSARRSIDLFLPEVSVYISVTTTPRERKRGDWPHELDKLVSLSKVGQIKAWTFVGFMYHGRKTEPATIQEELRCVSSNARVVMAKDIDSHARFMEGLCQRKP